MTTEGTEDTTCRGLSDRHQAATKHVLSNCELVSTEEGRRSGTITRPLKLVKKNSG